MEVISRLSGFSEAFHGWRFIDGLNYLVSISKDKQHENHRYVVDYAIIKALKHTRGAPWTD
jgi:hypothetical protein